MTDNNFKLLINESISKMKDYESKLISELDSLDLEYKSIHNLEVKKNLLIENNKEKEIRINIGGKLFQTTLYTLLSITDNLFYKLLLKENFDFEQEIFIDRSFELFPIILSYLRYHNINLDSYSYDLIKKLKKEAYFYEITCLEQKLDIEMSKIKVIDVVVSGNYLYQGQPISTNKVDNISNLSDESGIRGIVTLSPGWIIFDLNRHANIKTISIMGYKGNTTFSSSNGSGAKIFVGTNRSSFKEVGLIPSNFNLNISKVILQKPVAGNCIKLQHTSYIGIGYFKVE